MTLEQGDPFEVMHREWLRLRLPSYERIWRDFIGHDGWCHPLPMAGLSRDQEARRRAFYQAHYTMAQRCLNIDDSLKRADDTLAAVNDHESLRNEFECLYNLLCAIGHVRDMFVKMDAALKLGGHVGGALQEFYDVRSHVMHGPQMAYVIEANLLKIPMIATRNKLGSEWDDESCWDDMDASTFCFAADFCREAGNAFFALVNKLHPAVYEGAFRLFDGKKVSWSRRPVIYQEISIRHGGIAPSLCAGSGNVTKMLGYAPIGSGGCIWQAKTGGDPS
jgi:hypothetical protein